ncbi:MAG: S8 family peptidase [Candidatus Aminicenantes bacterium]
MKERVLQYGKCLSSFLLILGLFFPFGYPGEPLQARKIVVFKPGFDKENAKDKLLKESGAFKIKSIKLVNAVAVHISSKAEMALLKKNEVARIDDDPIVRAVGKKSGKNKKAPPSQPFQEFPWNIFRIGAHLTWAETKGTAVRVAILDTGIDLDHPDLSANIRGDTNTIKAKKSGDDDNGHGTHVAGVVAAVDNSIGIIGVGPEIDLWAVKVLDKKGRGRLSDLIDGLDWCISQKIQIVNMSLGTLEGNLTFHEAIKKVHQSGVIQVAAAGNNGEDGGAVSFPAAYPETIAVSAVDAYGNFASFSSYGEEIDLTAPGTDIRSTHKDGFYTVMDGTSASAPHVAGTVALILTVIPDRHFDVNGNGIWDPAEVKTKLKLTAEDLGLTVQQQGAGFIRADEAIR